MLGYFFGVTVALSPAVDCELRSGPFHGSLSTPLDECGGAQGSAWSRLECFVGASEDASVHSAVDVRILFRGLCPQG